MTTYLNVSTINVYKWRNTHPPTFPPLKTLKPLKETKRAIHPLPLLLSFEKPINRLCTANNPKTPQKPINVLCIVNNPP